MAKEKKKERNRQAYLARSKEASRSNSATKATNKSTKSAAKKTAPKSRTAAPFVPFATCQERDKIVIPLMGDVDPRAAFECAHSTEYFTELIESGHDPLWTYRYI